MSEEKKSFTGSLLRGLTRNTVESLAMKMGLKPSDPGWVAVDIGASLVSSSPKVAMEFFKAVQEVAAARDHYRADYAAVVTNASFTRAAQDLAASTGVKLVSYVDMTRSLGPETVHQI